MPYLNSKLVLIRVDPVVEKDDDGVYTQEEWQSLPPTGVVEETAIDVGFVKVGDRVEFLRYTAIPVSYDKDLRLCREDAVLMVLDAER